MSLSQWCEHKPTWVGRVAVAACADCGRVDWFSDTGPVDSAEAMAYLFGSFDLVGHLDALPKNVWLEVGPRLWLAHDGEVLLLATDHQLLIENLTRGA